MLRNHNLVIAHTSQYNILTWWLLYEFWVWKKMHARGKKNLLYLQCCKNDISYILVPENLITIKQIFIAQFNGIVKYFAMSKLLFIIPKFHFLVSNVSEPENLSRYRCKTIFLWCSFINCILNQGKDEL